MERKVLTVISSKSGIVRQMSSLIRDKAYVNGGWVEAISGKNFEVTNPLNSKVLCTVPDMDTADVQAAVDAAHHAFQHLCSLNF
ncbi:uncharacterized protein LOC111716177 isoform X2 [Eurytemora carolleeae]|uniref:uncharacterized protein LOC111716177 isoform X2 n=1 Tax=Eurytemora carolleeae TaxID=1294199 RepID=UPI000C762187|nr:uncharacterized protein LOC111716177 isoform X2 [Eurytemora carolleeae]|eukprot:XP_023347375.1 uncharacterized protein LOC111716177 isoform X2 [Eurytemora affinis]